jgi:hypothetical protein
MDQRRNHKEYYKILEINENPMHKMFWNAIKVVLTGSFASTNTYTKTKQKINNLTFHLKEM